MGQGEHIDTHAHTHVRKKRTTERVHLLIREKGAFEHAGEKTISVYTFL